MEQIKSFFGLTPTEHLLNTSYFYKQGINEIEIKEVCKSYNGTQSIQYTLRLRLNFSRVIGGNAYEIMSLTVSNIKKVQTIINKILKNTLRLDQRNSRLQEYLVIRLDTSFDIFVQYPELLILLMNLSLYLPPKKQCKVRLPKDVEQYRRQMHESIRFGNDSYTYNGYVKLPELMAKGKVITEIESQRLQYLVRLERQNQESALKKLLSGKRRFGDLTNKSVIQNILRTMIDDVGVFFGKGNFYSKERIQAMFQDSNIDISGFRSQLNLLLKGELYRNLNPTKVFVETMETLGIAPTVIAKFLLDKYGMDEVQGIYNMLVSKYTRPQEKRCYHSFPIPHPKANGRLSAGITLHPVGVYPSKVETASGRTMDEYEADVWKRLKRIYVGNIRYLNSQDVIVRRTVEKSVDDILRFRRAVSSESVKNEVDKFIHTVNLYRDECVRKEVTEI